MRNGHSDLIRIHNFVAEEGIEQNAAHFAGSDNCDFLSA
jgi:hypothetical protein